METPKTVVRVKGLDKGVTVLTGLIALDSIAHLLNASIERQKFSTLAKRVTQLEQRDRSAER